MRRKSKTPSYLSPKRLLSPKEYNEYIENKKIIQTRNLRERIKELKSERTFRRTTAKRASTISGRIGSKMVSGIRTLSQRGGITRALYRSEGQLPPTNIQQRFKTTQGVKSGKRGRPKGTYDQRYAQYGGVYGFRKWQATQFKIQRIEALRRAAVNPRQQQILNQIEARNQAVGTNVESQPIPNTFGRVPMNSIFQEIDNASHLFD